MTSHHTADPLDQYRALPTDEAVVAFSNRFRQTSNKYPRMVTLAYGYEHAAAMRDDDNTVADTVANWERSQGIDPRDWAAIGRQEGRES